MNTINKFKKMLMLALTICLTSAMLPVINTVSATENETTSRIIVIGEDETNKGVYELAKAQFDAVGHPVTLVYSNKVSSDVTSNDIVVMPNGGSDYGSEGYQISKGTNESVVVTANNKAGVRYGLNDVLHQLMKNDSVSSVDTTQPFKETRGLFVDCGRKYFSISWFENIIREMAWNGMNTLYLSFSNDEGFRFLLNDMSLSFDDGEGNTITYSNEFMSHLVDNPEKVSDSDFLTQRNSTATDEGNTRKVLNYDNNKYYDEDDMKDILAYAKAYGINVVPEFNSPGHIGQVLWYFPAYRIQGTWYSDGQPHYGLDLTKQEAFNFGQALVKKYIDFFVENGVTSFNVGGDEYSKGSATNEKVASYTNALAEYAINKGMTVYAWNDGQAAANNLLNEDVIVLAWNGNNANYQSVNLNNKYLYYVLKTYDWKPDAKTLFSTWTPLTYANDNIVANSDNIKGASLAIWCDIPNRETEDKILNSMIPNIQSFGYRMWNYTDTTLATLASTGTTLSYDEFKASVVSAPVVDEATVFSTVNYVSQNEEELPEPSLGAGYELVTFNGPSVSSNANWYDNNSGDNVIDGDTSNYSWTNSAQSVGQYIRVDLGSVQTINNISITSPADGDICTNANVQVSSDGETWNTVGDHSGSSSESVTQTYNVNKSIRYIQVVITESSTKWWKLSEISWDPKAKTTDTIEDGTYIIVNDTNKAMTHTTSGSGFDKSEVTITDNIATPVNNVYEWTFTKQEDGTYYITDSKGEYLNITGSGISLSTTPQSITATISGDEVQLSNGNNAINYYKSKGQRFDRWNTGTGDPNNMQTLYKKLAGGLSTISLYNAIIRAKGYNNDDNRYGSVEFNELQTILAESIALYKNASSENTSVTQEAIDQQTEMLIAAIEALLISDTTYNYIEIPVEILDFRADGVMFEYGQNVAGKGLYELLTEKFGKLTYANETVDMPGVNGDRISDDEWNHWRENCKRMGLVEDELINGQPVYKEKTVDYVAKIIAKGYFDDLSSKVTN